MKNSINLIASTLIITILGLTACSSASNQAASTTSTGGTNNAQGSTNLSQVNMLLVGSLKLESTNQAITSEEAVKLLPLWQAYRSLSTSQTAAEAEVVALLNQIQSTMTGEQFQAIKAMNLNNTDMMNLMQSMGGGMGSQGTPNPQSTPGINVPNGVIISGNPPSGSSGGPSGGPPGEVLSGGPPAGGPPSISIVGGGDAGSAAGLNGGPMAQGTQDPSTQATAQARFSTQASRVNTILLDVLITKLEAITQNNSQQATPQVTPQSTP